ncbi:HAMP domain-containing sensor histidine kinase [Paenibacillus sp. MMS20-IR301]|uniref:sensor histidine kinase n=1 Tax=Paenibacillus sp. MMS20-IR301 TaxID=2895946 RepID=UPI0028E6F6F4|nr:HAMP domain-containing sensor histidine kinase [Paenibacillus sp. MMS20-IR301]WNS44079.1 HAMP domain-containing sensor histidine kinase [Paenibacillus sp. MMS20-IR301]
MKKPGLRFKMITSMYIIILLPLLLLSSVAIGTGINGDSSAGDAYYGIIPVVIIVSFPLIFCTVWMTRIITRQVLLPLRELTLVAEQIVQGNMDCPITYQADDEMGRFSAVFELMRTRLLESKANQDAYEQARNELIASISHDLRTPLSSIRGYVEGLQDGVAHDEIKFKRYLSIIRDKADKLNDLIEDLFRFSELETGQLQMNYEETECAALLESIVRPLEYELAEGRATLTVVRPFPAGAVRADPVRLTQVFNNLVGNATKYAGEAAQITISASPAGGRLEVSVRDNGPEIAPEHLPRLFERFYRGDKSRSSHLGGAGLGLAICKYIIEAHGGEIGVRSSPGAGNVFYFNLPLLS